MLYVQTSYDSVLCTASILYAIRAARAAEPATLMQAASEPEQSDTLRAAVAVAVAVASDSGSGSG